MPSNKKQLSSRLPNSSLSWNRDFSMSMTSFSDAELTLSLCTTFSSFDLIHELVDSFGGDNFLVFVGQDLDILTVLLLRLISKCLFAKLFIKDNQCEILANRKAGFLCAEVFKSSQSPHKDARR